MSSTDVAERATANPVAIFTQQVKTREQEFAAALPAHIPAERFVRVIMTAVNKNPALLYADRASLFSAAMMAAADGLLCDGREAALVIYNTKKKDEQGKEHWIQAVQYMPMVAGILKKVRNSGELSTIVAKVVYAGDKFKNWIDNEGEHLEYEAGDAQDRNIVLCAFAMAKLKDGAIEVEVLKPADIEKIRSVSRSKDKGPWVDWWEEMAKKSAIRRLSKRLPLNTDLDDLIRRDDPLYDFDAAREDAAEQGRRSLGSRLDQLAAIPPSDAPTMAINGDTNSTAPTETGAHSQAGAGTAGGADHQPDPDRAPPADKSSSPQPTATAPARETVSAATDRAAPESPPKDSGAAKAADTASATAPKNEAEYLAYADAWREALTDAEEGEKRWPAEKAMRNKCHVGPEARETLQEKLTAKYREIRDADRS